MLDSTVRRYIDPPLNRLATVCAGYGLTANMVTAAGFALSLAAFAALAMQDYGLALVFILASRVMDGLDGPLARQTAATDLGGFLDIVADFIFYSGAVFFFAVGRPEHALAAACLIFSFMGTASSFLAYAIIAAKRDISDERQGKKSFFYVSGLAEGTETILVLVLVCLWPDAFSVIAVSYAALCWLTTLGRVMQAMANFR